MVSTLTRNREESSPSSPPAIRPRRQLRRYGGVATGVLQPGDGLSGVQTWDRDVLVPSYCRTRSEFDVVMKPADISAVPKVVLKVWLSFTKRWYNRDSAFSSLS